MTDQQQRWHNERKGEVPDFRPDSQLYSIRSANHAVETACLARGTIFRSINNYAYNAMYMPLMTVAEQMKVLMCALDRWAFRAKFLQHLDPQMTRTFGNTRIPDKLKFRKIHRHLDRCGLLDYDYCDVFETTGEKLVPILNAMESLIAFLNAICTEGNLLSFDNLSGPMASSTVSSTAENITSAEAPSASETRLATPARSRTPEPAYHQFAPLPASPPPPPPHPTIPSWKLGLAHKYAVENLYVGEAELEVFAKVLTHARETQDEVNAAVQTCKDFSELALDMLGVFESWMGRCDEYEDGRFKAKDTDDVSESYSGYGGGYQSSVAKPLR